MSKVSIVWVRLPFSNLRSISGICDEYGITRQEFTAHNPGPVAVTAGITHYHVPVEQPGWIDELSLAAAKAIDKELSIDMPEMPAWQRVALIQCRVTDAVQEALYRYRKEQSK